MITETFLAPFPMKSFISFESEEVSCLETLSFTMRELILIFCNVFISWDLDGCWNSYWFHSVIPTTFRNQNRQKIRPPSHPGNIRKEMEKCVR